ncbi:UDP-glucuronosyltransferase 2A2-like [Spea bombifrons]|uniref:UDP-glucuronosyltransferase 2A2-like n=1 Tax=Spea bombifrons TaxID=233779 RepID=UPI00234AC2C6|nr:UDP-glucuronosyltransferase 2A2-like [Spea bombifrons]
MATTKTLFYIFAFIFSLHLSPAHTGKILVVPVEGSHWINIKVLMMELYQRGHKLTVMRPSNSIYIDESSDHFKVENIRLSDDHALSREQFEEYALNWILSNAFPKDVSSFSTAWEFIRTIGTGTQTATATLTAVFENKELMERLRTSGFDLVLADPFNVGGVMLANYLKLPLVFFGRWMPTEDIHFAIAPSPLSYVPVIHSRVTDRMTFPERIKNVLLYTMYFLASRVLVYPVYDELCKRYLDSEVSVFELYQRADIYLMKVDFVFEFPRPTMPNAVYIGGFQCQTPKPLPQELQEFMDSSEQGVVVFSLGTLVKTLPLKIAREIAAGLAQLPERVIWRYTGEKPDTLGNNTKTMTWLPQNDLLSHPNIKAFLSHGGENGIYEAIYHGVPVVGVPLFGDQYENILRLKAKGAAVMLDNLLDVTSTEIFNAVRLVIDNPSYGAAMKHISKLHRDTPVSPRDTAVFWTEFVMRHNGAEHLRAVGNDLPWYQYYVLDVIGALVATLAVIIYLSWKVLGAIIKICLRGRKSKQD